MRLLRADTSIITFDGLIPLAIQHAQDWNALLRMSKSEVKTPQEYIGTCLSSKIHPAAYSREAELNYLRGLVTALLPHLLPAIHVSTNNKVIIYSFEIHSSFYIEKLLYILYTYEYLRDLLYRETIM